MELENKPGCGAGDAIRGALSTRTTRESVFEPDRN